MSLRPISLPLKEVTALQDDQGNIWKTEAEYKAHLDRLNEEKVRREKEKLRQDIAQYLPMGIAPAVSLFLNNATKEELETLKSMFAEIRKRQKVVLNDLSFQGYALGVGSK